MSSPAPATPRQSAQIFASLRKAFTPLSKLHAPLLVGYVDTATLARLMSSIKNVPQPIYLLPQGIWHAAVRGLGAEGKGVIADDEMASFVSPFDATRSLLTAARNNIDALTGFLDQIEKQSNGAHILERCIREGETRTVWMTQQQGWRFPTEQEIDKLLDRVHGEGDSDESSAQ